jgi:hypothetical protein
MIAYALLRIVARSHRITMPMLRFTDLVMRCLFERRHIAAIERPPPVNPSHTNFPCSPNQMSFAYA